METIELQFDASERFWSPDHSSICFSGRAGDRIVLFYLPRSTHTSLSRSSSNLPPAEGEFLRMFDKCASLLHLAAAHVFSSSGPHSTAYVLTSESIAIGQQAVCTMSLAA